MRPTKRAVVTVFQYRQLLFSTLWVGVNFWGMEVRSDERKRDELIDADEEGQRKDEGL